MTRVLLGVALLLLLLLLLLVLDMFPATLLTLIDVLGEVANTRYKIGFRRKHSGKCGGREGGGGGGDGKHFCVHTVDDVADVLL